MSKGKTDDQEKRWLLKFVIDNYREQLQIAKEEIKPSKINIKYPLLSTLYNEEFGKDFLQNNYNQKVKHVGNRSNKGRDD